MLGVFAPAPNSLANLPLIGGVPITLITFTSLLTSPSPPPPPPLPPPLPSSPF